MNKKLIGLGMLLAANGAFAQTASPSSIEIYGIFDIGVGHSQHSLSEDPLFPVNMNPIATKAGNTADTGMFNGGLSPSRLGFKGSEDLGGGLRATFVLETGFNSPYGTIANGVGSVANNSPAQTTVNADSSLAGQLFNRQANVGLSSAQWGSFTVGRNYSLGYETVMAFDPMEGSQTFSPLGYSGSYGAGGYTEDFRIDNSIKYKFATNGFNVGALYKFGGQTGTTDAQSEFQLTLGYENGPFAIQGAYGNAKDALTAGNGAAIGQVAVTAADTTSYMLSGSYKMDQWKLRGGYERMNFNNPSNAGLDAGITTLFGYGVSSVKTTAFNNEKQLNVYFAGLTLDVTPAFATTVAYYDVKQNDYTVGGCPAVTASTCSGTSSFYSILGDYKLSKRTHLYAGYMYNRVDGGLGAGFVDNSNGFFGTGIKHAF